MIGAGPVDGRELSHHEHDRIWSAFVDHAVTPVFHVADQVRVFDDCWYQDDPVQDLVPATEAVFLWVPPALALSDLILHGVFDRHPRLRFGVVELSSAWVPQFLMMLDGASAFTAQLNGKPVAKLSRRPSQYFLDHVRVSSFSYENPKQRAKMTGDVFMFCSDYPHSEGTATPLDDYRRRVARTRKCRVSFTPTSNRCSTDRRPQRPDRLSRVRFRSREPAEIR
jgi:hypothetical protein